jgi:transcriptional regulator with XRE-family HTH domain
MNCEKCQREMKERKATLQHPYMFDLSGLPHVALVGITVRVCPSCKVEVPIIPRIEELHRVIARGLIQKPDPLRGDEVRFLRKLARFPAKKFAALLRVSPEHLSRVENGHTHAFGDQTDLLVRTLATAILDGEHVWDMLMKMADTLDRPEKQTESQPLFRLEQNHWKEAA